MPITLILLLVVFGALVAAGIPVLLALTALTAAIGVVTIGQPLAAGQRHHLRGRGDRRDGGRRRLLAVLPAPRARGAGAGPVVPRRAPDRRAHVGPHDPGVRPDRDGHHGRPVLRRRRPVQRHRARHDRRGGHRGHRLADRAARAAGLARAEGGRRADPVPRPQAGRRPAVPALGGAGPPGGRQAGDLGRRRHDRAARAGRAGARPAARRTRRRRAEGRGRGPDDDRDPAGVPAGPGARARSW